MSSPDTAGSSLYQLSYCSRARVAPDEAHFREMCERFATRNTAFAITGIFLTLGDRFIQVLEGERSAVEQLATNIRRDVRHLEFRILLQREIPERAFGDWSMAGLYLGSEVAATPVELERLEHLLREVLQQPNEPQHWRETLRKLPALLRPRRRVGAAPGGPATGPAKPLHRTG
ncbi:BLUF domain-containing protein [Algiphilus sp.]|uniref:BLUF domain-containing protein n=1 Tax=Algiphilus sp. TaxID=1872431 RepID=UPI0025BF2AAC|nr:BLUF domain-containing protein [Algiphilus sp.]MCK5771127.1 BLUF domain-containing protein [Algiphilus sp.]